MLTLVLLAAAPPAQAFCGTYVGDGTTRLTNSASQLVVARSGVSTTLTMFNDFEGDLSSFGLVVPVPAGVDSDNVRLADRALLEKLDGYSQPRLVAYTCDDYYGLSDAAVTSSTRAPAASPVSAPASSPSSTSSSGGCSGGDGGSWYADTTDTGPSPDTDTGDGVVVEDEFDLGEYTAWVVDPDGSEGLLAWLDANGFAVDASTSALFDEYIASGSHFLALRVDLDRLNASNWLSPLQVGYDSEAWGLPIRMGAASSAGVQDLVVYALTDPTAGRTGISNYPETEAPASDCLVDVPEDETVLDWYQDQFEATTNLPADAAELDGRTGFAWVTEYGWGSGACDPCTAAGPLTSDEVYALGFPAHYGWYLTRLHLRYTPDAVTQDLSFYTSNITAPTQLRYVEDTWEMEGELPICGSDAPLTAPACYSSEYWARKAEEGAPGTHVISDPKKGCGGVDSRATALLLLPLLLWRRRR
jgi:hypothetical protein